MPKTGLGTKVVVFTVTVVIVVAAVGLVSLAQPGASPKTSSNGASGATFPYRTMPKEFAVGGYKFYMGYNGTGFPTTVNGSLTVNLGFNLELTVSNGLANQTAVFGWAPPAPSPSALPTPDSATLFGGEVDLDWFVNSTGTYLQVSTDTGATTTVTATVGSTPAAVTLNGTIFDMDNVTGIMVTSSNTFHFNNGSVTFRGVNFQTVCTTYAGGCPGVPAPPAGVTVVYPSGPGITVNVTFADHSSETIGGGFPIVPVDFRAYTHHVNPQAGILIVYASSSPSFKCYLLVSA